MKINQDFVPPGLMSLQKGCYLKKYREHIGSGVYADVSISQTGKFS